MNDREVLERFCGKPRRRTQITTYVWFVGYYAPREIIRHWWRGQRGK